MYKYARFRYMVILPVILLSWLSSEGQQITGTVFAADDSVRVNLPGVNIYWENTFAGTVSGEDGGFTIPRNQKTNNLVFSSVGYQKRIIPVGGTASLEVELFSDLELEEVLVIRKDPGRRISGHNPILTESINGAELLKAACCNLAESFETNPSVDVSYNDAVSGAKQIRLLGLEGIYSQLQTDNISNFRGLATNFGLTYIPGPWMESIQVSKGAASVINGYESITGQINVAFKKSDSDEKLHLNAYADADGKLEMNANGNIRLYNDQLTTGLFFHAENLSNSIDHNHDGFLDHPMTSQVHFLNSWKYHNKKGFMLHGALRYLWDDRLGGQAKGKNGMQGHLADPYTIGMLNRMFEGQFKAGNVWPSGHTALAFLSSITLHDQTSSYGRNEYLGNERRFYSNLILTHDLDNESRHTLNTGMSYFFNRFDENLNSRETGRVESVPGVFAEYTFKPHERLTLLTGIRADLHNRFGSFMTPRLHFRYQPAGWLTFRISAGKGYRTANVLAENQYLLSNYRSLSLVETMQEEAWNYGLSMVQHYRLFKKDLHLTLEYFRTDFIRQLVINKEADPEYIYLQPLDGKSFAHTFQAELRYPVIKNLDLTLAYRLNNVQQTINGQLQQKPFSGRYKGLATVNYTTNMKRWMFDYTLQLNGGGRLPVYPGSLLPDEFPSHTQMNLQITRFFRNWNIYAGSENLTGFRQENPVLGADHPFSPGFDATNVWGPVMGRRIYAGLRYTLKYD